MAELRDVVAYLCKHYPHNHELSKARLTKLVYLADWKAAIEGRRQMTPIQWVFNRYGPYVEDVYQLAMDDAAFNVENDWTLFGNPKETISLKREFDMTSLTAEDKRTLDHVINQTQRLSWDEFIQLVYSTYPVLTGTRGAQMDLVAAAEKYTTMKVEPAA